MTTFNHILPRLKLISQILYHKANLSLLKRDLDIDVRNDVRKRSKARKCPKSNPKFDEICDDLSEILNQTFLDDQIAQNPRKHESKFPEIPKIFENFGNFQHQSGCY